MRVDRFGGSHYVATAVAGSAVSKGANRYLTSADGNRMSKDAGRSDLEELSERLERARGELRGDQPTGSTDGAAMGAAMRMATELILAVVVGGAIGWFLDDWLGTRPWLLILFFLLGFGAGLKNLFRAAAKTDGPPDAGEEE